MSNMGKSYVGDVGTDLEVETGIDLTEVATSVFKIRKPENSEIIEWTATVKEPALDGILTYTIQEDDFSVAGEYYLAAYVTLSDGSKFTGEVATFTIHNIFT